MKCLILAAGYATRLYPLTENFPKPLLEVHGKTILDWLIEDVDSSGIIDEYVVISNHKYVKHFRKWATKIEKNITIVDDGTISNETRLGAVRDIQLAVEKIAINDDVLVIAGDNLLDFSLTSFITYAQEKKASCVMRYFEKNEIKLRKCGVVTIDETDRVTNMTEKSPEPESHWCTPPFYYYISKDVKMIQQAIDEGCDVDAPGSFVAWLCKRSHVYAMEMLGKRFDIGNIESYESVKREFKGF